MVFYSIKLEGSDEDIQNMVEVIAETDENFEGDETDTEYDFMEDGNEDLEKEDFESIAIDMAKAAQNAEFIIEGEECNHGYFMSFKIVFKDKELISKYSDWYVSHVCSRFNYESYEDFCDSTEWGNRISEERFNEYLKNETELVAINSGNGEIFTRDAIPMTSNIIKWEGNSDDSEDEDE